MRSGQAFFHHVTENLSKFGCSAVEPGRTVLIGDLGEVWAGCSHSPASTRLSTAPDRDEERALATIHAALDAGVTFFDTADAYCWHDSETGQALVEYSLILCLVVVVVIVALILLGNSVKNTYCNVTGAVGA